MSETPVLELTRDEIVSRLDRGAQRRLHCSAQEFVRAYRAGNLADPGAFADLLALVYLLPDSDPLFDGARA